MKKISYKTREKGLVATFLSTSLKGISQVLLIDNTITGFIILLAVTTASPLLGTITLLSAFIGTAVGLAGGADKKLVSTGLIGYNPVLTGMALIIFLSGPYSWIIALFGAAVTAVFTATMMHLLKKSDLPVLTFPFIIVTWVALLASYRLKVFQISPEITPQSLSQWQLDITGKVNWIDGTFNGIGQIFFLHSTLSGILFFIAVFWAGWKFGVYAIIGNSIAIFSAYALGGENSLIFLGLYGYNAILTIYAVSLVFNHSKTYLSKFIGVIAAILTVPLTAGIATFLIPFGLPALTMPFVLTTWLILGARKVFPNF